MVVMPFALCIGVLAQNSIDKLMEDMDKNPNARVTSIKKRDPDTRKVLKVTNTIRLTDAQFAKRALAAFEKEEENALTSVKEKGSRVEYILTYRNKVEKRTYILNIRENDNVEISVFVTPVSEGDTSWTGGDSMQLSGVSFSRSDIERNLAQWQQLNGLGGKTQAEVKEYLKHNDTQKEANEANVNDKPIAGDTSNENDQPDK